MDCDVTESSHFLHISVVEAKAIFLSSSDILFIKTAFTSKRLSIVLFPRDHLDLTKFCLYLARCEYKST